MIDTPRRMEPAVTLRHRHTGLVLLVVSLLIFACSAAWLIGILSHIAISRDPTVQAGLNNLAQLKPYWIASAGMWLALTGILVALRLRGSLVQPDGQHLRPWLTAAAAVVLVAIALRAPVILTHTPSISDDIWRFMFDGRVLASGHNPYLVAPADVDADHPRFPWESELAARTNNGNLVTIYLPTSQLFFAGAAWITPPDAWAEPERATIPFRLVFVAFELVAIVLMLMALRRGHRSAWWAIVYAWHPLSVTEIAASGHHDPIGYAFLIAALLLADTKASRPLAWSSLLAVGGAVKPFPIPLALIALRSQPLRTWLMAAGAGLITSLALYLPFLATHEFEPARGLWDTTQNFIWRWSFQGSVYSILHALAFTPENARRICMALLGIVLIVLYGCRIDLWRSARVFLFAALLFSTTAHPWYLPWALVLTPISFSPAVWIASLTLPWGYFVLTDVVGWSVPPWLGVITYLPVYGALLVDWTCLWRRRHAGDSQAVH